MRGGLTRKMNTGSSGIRAKQIRVGGFLSYLERSPVAFGFDVTD